MVRTTNIPHMNSDRLNRTNKRNIRNTPRGGFNCAGYALRTFSWYCPFGQYDGDLDSILFQRFEGNAEETLNYTVQYMLNDFPLVLRLISDLSEAQADEEIVAYRIAMDGWDFHFLRRCRDGKWRGKMGGTYGIHTYTQEQVFDTESEAWREGIYNSRMVLFALRK